jgi:hypothetical protein
VEVVLLPERRVAPQDLVVQRVDLVLLAPHVQVALPVERVLAVLPVVHRDPVDLLERVVPVEAQVDSPAHAQVALPVVLVLVHQAEHRVEVALVVVEQVVVVRHSADRLDAVAIPKNLSH